MLTLIRHAPTLPNYVGEFVGSLDVECTVDGLESARALRPIFPINSFSSHFTSPLLRCRATFECIFPDITPAVHSALRERGLGEWEGQPRNELQTQFPRAFLPSGNLDLRFTPPGGEPLEALIKRVEGFMDQITTLGTDERVVAITHNGIIRVIQHLLREVPIDAAFEVNIPFLKPLTYELSAKCTADRKLHSS